MITPVSTNSYEPTFTGYKHPLKTLFKEGKMPSVKYGLYGFPINPENVSLEHLKPHSWGGRTELSNLALAERSANSARGSRPLADVLSWDMLEKYLSQFNFRIRKVFDGYSYQDKVRRTCENLGIVNPSPSLSEVTEKEIAKELPKKILRSMRNKAKKAKLDIKV